MGSGVAMVSAPAHEFGAWWDCSMDGRWPGMSMTLRTSTNADSHAGTQCAWTGGACTRKSRRSHPPIPD
jgi:hypothetical protein